MTAQPSFAQPGSSEAFPLPPFAGGSWPWLVLIGSFVMLTALALALVSNSTAAQKGQAQAQWWRTHSLRVLIDAEQLAQVFTNLLVNAADAAPEGSDLTLTTCTLPSGAWRSRLHNGGPAIPPETLAHAFEIFFSTKPGGTGIGLALCQRIVDEHGGTISLESAPESGTTAIVTLPPVGD